MYFFPVFYKFKPALWSQWALPIIWCDGQEVLPWLLGRNSRSSLSDWSFRCCLFQYVFIYLSIQQIPIVCQIESHYWYFSSLWLVENETTATTKLRRCSFAQTWRIFDQTHTSIMSCTGATSWRRWGSMDVGPENQPLRWAASQGRRGWRGRWYLYLSRMMGESPTHERPLNNDLLSRFLCCLNHWKASCSWRSPVLIWLRELSRRKNTG